MAEFCVCVRLHAIQYLCVSNGKMALAAHRYGWPAVSSQFAAKLHNYDLNVSK